ncbi:Protein of unknown function [Pyronema omphalodes CBS 100304]|uniref:Uncharacterized protein n=1 Tax=Pyronema omphalodes (strain CBS 100304) TaxID=1076935 RepID=U4LJL2_PYROM|nr:Protein of unknown function [Pyronema omphalodes CBS 100304]
MGTTPRLHIIGMLLLKAMPLIMKRLGHSMTHQMPVDPWLAP